LGGGEETVAKESHKGEPGSYPGKSVQFGNTEKNSKKSEFEKKDPINCIHCTFGARSHTNGWCKDNTRKNGQGDETHCQKMTSAHSKLTEIRPITTSVTRFGEGKVCDEKKSSGVGRWSVTKKERLVLGS